MFGCQCRVYTVGSGPFPGPGIFITGPDQALLNYSSFKNYYKKILVKTVIFFYHINASYSMYGTVYEMIESKKYINSDGFGQKWSGVTMLM